MAGASVRIVDALKQEAAAYAAGLGLSLSGLVAVALRDYLDARRVQPAFAAHPPGLARGEAASLAQPVRQVPKVGANQPCPCGKGRKYRQCHGAPSA